MDFAHGTKLHAALPNYAANGSVRDWLVMVERVELTSNVDRWVTGYVDSLTNVAGWDIGHYYSDRDEAMTGLHMRAGTVWYLS